MNQTLERTEKRATIQDIARLTGVSVATVSGAFSGKRRMSEQTRETVLTTARELGFEPNPHAQRLRNGGCANTVGLLSETDLGIATMMLSEVRHRLDERGFAIDDHLTSRYLQQAATRQTEVLRRICRQNPQAILFPNGGLEPCAFETLQQYVEGGGVLVCWASQRTSPDNTHLIADRVLIDSEDESYRQARHLIELGHRKLGFCAHSYEGHEGARFDGFRRALAEEGLELRPQWIWHEYGYEDAGIRHGERFLTLRERPTGMCIVNDNVAASFIHTVMRAGLRVPDEVSVIGTDDTAAARAAIVPVTTMRRPVKELSYAIVQLLCDRLDGTTTGAPVTREMKCELIVRGSTAAPKSR
jgi:LacI family repressor for deo operon, udp, cdd, tsx, nupC, and nupG